MSSWSLIDWLIAMPLAEVVPSPSIIQSYEGAFYLAFIIIVQTSHLPKVWQVDLCWKMKQNSGQEFVSCFWGSINIYRLFIEAYSKVTAPLTHFLSLKLHFVWSAEAATAFTNLKELPASASVLSNPDSSCQFVDSDIIFDVILS